MILIFSYFRRLEELLNVFAQIYGQQAALTLSVARLRLARVTLLIISGVSSECFERCRPFPRVSKYTK